MSDDLQPCPHCGRGRYTARQYTAILRLRSCELCRPQRADHVPHVGRPRAGTLSPAALIEQARAARMEERQEPDLLDPWEEEPAAAAAAIEQRQIGAVSLAHELLGVVVDFLGEYPDRAAAALAALEGVTMIVRQEAGRR